MLHEHEQTMLIEQTMPIAQKTRRTLGPTGFRSLLRVYYLFDAVI